MSVEMAARITSHDWARTPLGPRTYWPISLRTAVDLMLSARQPAYVAWGSELTSLYNDSYIPIMGSKHPAALGQPYATAFAEVWHEYGSLVAATLEGEAQYFIDRPIALHGRKDDGLSYFTFSWTPLRDSDGTVRGFYCSASETTDKILLQISQAQQRTQFQALVDHAPIGIYLLDADFKIRYVNSVALPAFAGIPDLIGSDFTKAILVLGTAQYAAELVAMFRAVLDTGVSNIQPERVEHRADSARLKYYACRIDRISMPDGRHGLVCYFSDITEQASARRALVENRHRQDFLFMLSNALGPLDDAMRIKAEAARLIGEHLGVSQAFYFDFDERTGTGVVQSDYCANGATSIVGRYEEKDIPTTIRMARQGRIFAIPDMIHATEFGAAEVQRHLDINVAAMICSPLVKRGRLMAIFSVTQAAPRSWSALELNLVRETSERTWAAVERARAEAGLRQSEDHYRASVELNPQITWTASADGNIASLSPRWTDLIGIPATDTPADGWLRALHPDDVETARAAWRRAVTTGLPLDQQMRILTRERVYHWARTRAYPRRDPEGKILEWFGTIEDVQERYTAAIALRDSEKRLQTLIEGVPQLVWRAVDQGRWTWTSPQWTDYTGQSESDSHLHGWLGVLHPEDRELALTAWRAAVAGAAFATEYRILHASEQRYRWFQSRATPVRNERGEVVEWLGTSTDIDEQRQLHLRQEVLVAELQHRTRNLMAVVRSTADRTLRTSTSLGDFEDKFRERLAALSRVQGLLSRMQDGGRITFDELLRSELTAHGAVDDSGRVVMRGPKGVLLRSSTVQTFAMALHELATNAAKYGALRQPAGRLEVHWKLEYPSRHQAWLHVDWRERRVDIPAASELPQGSGHGRELIERALPYQLGARTSFSIEADGIHCSIALPISQSPAADEKAAS